MGAGRVAAGLRKLGRVAYDNDNDDNHNGTNNDCYY